MEDVTDSFGTRCWGCRCELTDDEDSLEVVGALDDFLEPSGAAAVKLMLLLVVAAFAALL